MTGRARSRKPSDFGLSFEVAVHLEVGYECHSNRWVTCPPRRTPNPLVVRNESEAFLSSSYGFTLDIYI
jgi:hypothetical protein